MNISFGLFKRLPWCSSGKLLKESGGSSNKFSENELCLCNDALQDVNYDIIRMMEV